MKQGNAIDLLGQDDPRAKDIGIIYVSPTDDRRSVLAAILTQEKLERKQIAVVLPTQNKAFQRPADFDDLKNVRRKLQAQIVFIAPGGPGPAEFARQRRFPVYSSLDYYARALRDEAAATGTAPAAASTPDSGRKKGGLFSGGRSAASQEPPPSAGTTSQDAPHLRPAPPLSLPPLPLAPDRSGIPAASQVPPTPATPPGVQLAGAMEDRPTAPIAGFAATPFDSSDDPDDFRPPSSTPSVTPVGPIVNQGTASTFGPQGSVDRTPTNGGPEPLILGQGTKKPRRTIELDRNAAPVVPIPAPALPDPNEEAPPPPRRFGSKTAPIVAATAAGAALGANAAATGTEVPPWQATATSPASAKSSTPAAPLPTPIRTVPPPSVPPRQGGRSTGGRGGRNNGRRRAGRGLLLVILLICTIALCGGIALAAPYLGIHLPGSAAAPPAFTVNITPDVQTVTNQYVVSAVTSTADPNSLQVQARILTGDAQSTGQTANATGKKQTAPVTATGMLYFTNGSTKDFTVGTTTKFTTASGVAVYLDNPTTIPAADPIAGTLGKKNASAHAGSPGTSGNISAQSINMDCCSSTVSIHVINLNAFSGGVDPQNYTVVQQSDIDGVSNSITSGLVTKAQTALGAKLGKSERYAENGSCTPTVGSDHNAGDKASTVTVQVSVHCTREVYDMSQIAAVVTQHMSTTVKQTTGANFSKYAMLDGQGNVTTLATIQNEKQTNFNAQTGEVALQVQASGTWVYQFTPAIQQQFKTLIQGKPVAQATTILQSQPGVKSATIQPTTGTLPTDLGQFSIAVAKEHGVAAPGGGAGSGGGAAEGTPVTTSPTVGPLPTGTGVGMG